MTEKHKSGKNQPHGNANHPASEKESTKRHVYVEPGVRIDLVEDFRQEYRANQKTNTTYNDRQLFWTIVSAILIFIYAGLTGWQGCSAKRAADAATVAARTAKGQLVQMTTQSEDDQRAWIGVTGMRITELDLAHPKLPFVTKISLSNSGKSPAINLKRASAYMLSSTPVSGPKPEYIKKVDDKIAGIRDHIAVPPNGVNTLESSDNGNYVIPKWTAIIGKTEFVYIYGRFEYQDVSQ